MNTCPAEPNKSERPRFFDKGAILSDLDIAELSDEEVCDEIGRLTEEMMGVWGNSRGWAPDEAADLLEAAMLDCQVSLAKTLSLWLHGTSSGELILAWANLGTLVEGLLKLFLCLYIEGYIKDADAFCNPKTKRLIKPDKLRFENARCFIRKKMQWNQNCDWDFWIKAIQERRNSIHSFKPCNIGIGTFNDWKEDVRVYLAFLREMDSRLPPRPSEAG